MTDLPKQIDKKVRQEIAALDQPYEVVKKRDHYFLHVPGRSPVCIGNNSSKQNEWQTNKTIHEIRRVIDA
jgi:hypothetical protein